MPEHIAQEWEQFWRRWHSSFKSSKEDNWSSRWANTRRGSGEARISEELCNQDEKKMGRVLRCNKIPPQQEMLQGALRPHDLQHLQDQRRAKRSRRKFFCCHKPLWWMWVNVGKWRKLCNLQPRGHSVGKVNFSELLALNFQKLLYLIW